MSLSKLSNGTMKAERVRHPDLCLKFRSKPKFLATIDFGTTHCSVTYLVNADLVTDPTDTLDPTTLKLDDEGRTRVPSCILFDDRGNNIAFGYKARQRYADLKQEDRPRFIYFEHIKKHLQLEKKVDRNLKISALNGEGYYLVEVIAHVLHLLKEKVVAAVKDFGLKTIKATDFDWVVTVPAIWRGKGKQMMREAGYRAGLCSGETPLPLKSVSGALKPIEEKSPEKLSLALEPESAAIHCRRAAKDAEKCDEFVRAKKYLVVDIGGGTVDIATHALVGEHIEELAPPAGNFWGGTTVNEQFQDFLEKFVDDPGFSKYIEGGTNTDIARHKADLNKLCYQTFELHKQNFGNNVTLESYTIDFPRSFWSVYKDKLIEKKAKDVSIEDDGAAMRVFRPKMEEFFKPAINGICSLIEDHLQPNLVETIDTIYWVGGFGGCKYLRTKMEERLRKLKKFHFAVPIQPELAVIRGATAFRCDPSVVKQRRADATYGTSVNISFDAAIHRPDYKWWNEDRKKFQCKNLFQTFIQRGETICNDEVFITEFSTSTVDQTSAKVKIFSSPAQDTWYTTDDDVYELGEITVDVGGKGIDRKIEVIFDITHTEIQVRARDLQFGHESKVVIDFLSASK